MLGIPGDSKDNLECKSYDGTRGATERRMGVLISVRPTVKEDVP